jgi:hypothetical protein
MHLGLGPPSASHYPLFATICLFDIWSLELGAGSSRPPAPPPTPLVLKFQILLIGFGIEVDLPVATGHWAGQPMAANRLSSIQLAKSG